MTSNQQRHAQFLGTRRIAAMLLAVAVQYHCGPTMLAAADELPGATVGGVRKKAESKQPDWLDQVQTYCMLPLFPEDAKALHASVNGVWAGIGGTHPILPHTEHVPAVRKKYGDDAGAFVKKNHNAGLLVCAAVNGLEGMVPLRNVVPNLDAMACRNADGKPAVTDDGMTLMCTNNPAWVRWEFDRGKQAIDEGADVILLDTPMSSSFISGFLGAGFCDHCMRTFAQHLASKYRPAESRDQLELTKFEKAHVVERLRQFQSSNRQTRNQLGRDRYRWDDTGNDPDAKTGGRVGCF